MDSLRSLYFSWKHPFPHFQQQALLFTINSSQTLPALPTQLLTSSFVLINIRILSLFTNAHYTYFIAFVFLPSAGGCSYLPRQG